MTTATYIITALVIGVMLGTLVPFIPLSVVLAALFLGGMAETYVWQRMAMVGAFAMTSATLLFIGALVVSIP